MDRLKLQWRIFAFLLGFCALLLSLLWLFQTVFLSDMYKMIRRSEIENAIKLVERNIDSADLSDILRKLFNEKEILVTPTLEFDPPAKPPEYDHGGGPRQETLTETKVFTLENGQTISLTFHAMITPVNATVATLRVQLYIITGFVILLSVALALIIARRVSKPIVDINEGAKALAAGKYDTGFAGRGFREIKELSDTLNMAATELSKAEGLRRELMANISHDLRTPLALIYSYAEMMHDFPNEVTPEQTRIIMDETKRLTSLVNDVLDVSRLETGTMEINKRRYNLTESLRATVDRLARLLEKEGYHLSFDFDSEIYVTADEIKITQAFYNLLINAVHYSGDDKRVTVRQSIVKDFVKIEVIDNGEGIAPENLPYIWDRYYKVDKRHKRPITGTGLGLSIVKKIIDLHDGIYAVESEVKKGSIFWFMLKREE